MNFDAYSNRISLVPSNQFVPDIEGLRLLQTRHLLSVPFENLDINWRQSIVLDVEKFYTKIVDNNRGGFCYELNGLFNELLRHFGFQARLVSARVFSGSELGPDFDHAAIIVTIGENEYLADVGFGDFAAQPLLIAQGVEQLDREGVFRINAAGEDAFVVEKKKDDNWRPEYIFGTNGRPLSEFTEMCDFQQYSPDSHFRKGKVCSMLTETGRKTLTDKNFIVSTDRQREERPIGSESHFDEVLLREFGIRKTSFEL
ncbi:MAG: arylamine N-acetyltransferase family protein [Pyrinomonadaceae bacterium]